MNAEPSAWMVIAPNGFQAVFLQRARAEQYAVNCRGTVWPLFGESPKVDE